MIRRDAPDGSTWILISQLDHARVSAALAAYWGADGVAPLVDRKALLWAIEHHDDGWREWEQSPDVEPKSGRPRSFTEMDLADTLAIWRRSIELAGQHDPLSGYVVAGHFCRLLESFADRWQHDPRRVDAEQFLQTHRDAMARWLAAWLAQSSDHTPALAERALAQLQLFDALSLYFCCTPTLEPTKFATPDGAVITLTREPDGRFTTCTPPAFIVGKLNVEIFGRQVPARQYADRADLAAAGGASKVLATTVIDATANR